MAARVNFGSHFVHVVGRSAVRGSEDGTVGFSWDCPGRLHKVCAWSVSVWVGPLKVRVRFARVSCPRLRFVLKDRLHKVEACNFSPIAFRQDPRFCTQRGRFDAIGGAAAV
jgi:hypothetical protein